MDTKKEIAFLITSTGWGGLEMNVLKLANLLTQKDYQIHLISKKDSTIYQKRSENTFKGTFLLPDVKKYFDFKSAKKIANFLKEKGISKVIVFDNKDLDVTAWAKKLYYKKLKIIYQQQMQIGINKKDLLHTFRFKTIDAWVTPLNYLKEEISQRTKFPVERVKIIPLSVDIYKFIERKYTKEEALKKLGIKPKSTLVGIIGRISEKKGQLFLIESLIKLKEQGIDIELLIFGSPTVNDDDSKRYYEKILTVVKENNIEDSVHFVGHNDDISLFYNAVDIFVLASHSETYGMVTVEALLSKVPVVATKSGGTSGLLNYGKFGQLYEFGNHNDFIEKLLFVINNYEKAKETAEKAFVDAKKKYHLTQEADAFDDLLQNI